MYFDFIVAGFGGQGVLLIGNLLTYGAMEEGGPEDIQATWQILEAAVVALRSWLQVAVRRESRIAHPCAGPNGAAVGQVAVSTGRPARPSTLTEAAPGVLAMDELKVDKDTGRLTYRGKSMDMSPGKPLSLLALLARPIGRRHCLADIMREVWGDTLVSENTIDQHISKIRSCLRKRGGPLAELAGRIQGINGYRWIAYQDE